jgi:hypothetical protein
VTVTFTAADRSPCEPAHQVTLYAQPQGQPRQQAATGTSDAQGHASFTVTPQTTTVYDAVYSDISGQPPAVTVTVDRTSGTCATGLRLTAPAKASVRTAVPVTGNTSDTGTVTILFRKRGQSAFQARRSLTPAPDGAFSTSFTADDDYRLYASTSRCDSHPLLVQATPTIAGPATARRGSTVTLTVRALPGTTVRVFFHRAGGSGYAQRRSGTASASGIYTASYTADADYRYYALTGPDGRTSSTGLTQAR